MKNDATQLGSILRMGATFLKVVSIAGERINFSTPTGGRFACSRSSVGVLMRELTEDDIAELEAEESYLEQHGVTPFFQLDERQ